MMTYKDEKVFFDYYDKIYSRMSNDDKNNIASYTSSENVQELVLYMVGDRKQKDKEMEDKIKLLSRKIKLCHLPLPMTVYRGTGYYEFHSSSNVSSNIFINKTFLSTSRSYSIAKGFMEQYDHGFIMSIDLPKGYPALSLESISSFHHEEELLLLPNQKFNITGYEDKGDEYEGYFKLMKTDVEPIVSKKKAL